MYHVFVFKKNLRHDFKRSDYRKVIQTPKGNLKCCCFIVSLKCEVKIIIQYASQYANEHMFYLPDQGILAGESIFTTPLRHKRIHTHTHV